MWKSVGRAPSLRGCLTTKEKARKTLSQCKKTFSHVKENLRVKTSELKLQSINLIVKTSEYKPQSEYKP
jgi:hypothetical protein